jgi:hypothetical protein
MQSQSSSWIFRSLLTLCILSSSAFAGTWDLNDVSYLYPLPTRSTDTNFITAKDSIPSTWFSQTLADSTGFPFTIDAIQPVRGNPEQSRKIAMDSFNSIHLLAVRVDPCFKDLFSDVCRPQIRAVWQPIDKNFSSIDGAVHTFYDLSTTEFDAVLAQLMQLKAKYKIDTTGLPLQVHPGFQKNGFAKDLSALFKSWMKPERITRIAFQRLLALEFQWRFQSFDVKDGKLIPVQIAIHGGTVQTFAVHRGSIPPGTLELSEEELARSRNGEALEKILLDYSLRIENPRVNIPGTTDCLSCHAVGGVKGASAEALGMNEIPTVAAVVGLTGKYDLKNTSKNRQDPIHFRAFGYVTRDPSISDRVIIETAMVADSLNQLKSQP